MPLRVSCRGPVLRLFSSWGVAPSLRPLAWLGFSPPCGQACFCELALRAVGAARGRPGQASLAWVCGARAWALTHTRPPVLGACGRGPLPTCCGCGGCGRGDPSPTRLRALLRAGCARCGAGTRAPGGGASHAWMWGVRGWALSDARLPVLGACGQIPLPTGCVCGRCGRGTRHPSHSTRSCELALRAVGAARGRRGGGASCLGVGRSGSGALPRPTAHPWA